MSEPIRILIVEDLEADAHLAMREIRKVVQICEFQCVETREDYLRALERFQPDLILSDYHLPQFDGMSALHLALEHAPLTPLIIWTGSLSEDIAVDCMKAGANNYVIKENMLRLGPAVIHALEERRLLLERKQVEEKYQAIFENSPEGIFQSLPDGRYIKVNPAMARIYGYDSPQAMLSSITDISRQIHVDPLERDAFVKALQTHGSIENFEGENQRKDGSIIWTSTSARVVRDADGNVLYYEGFLQDITQRKQAEGALEKSEKHFRALIENGLDNISLLAADGTLLWESPAVFRTLDYAPDEFVGQVIFKLMHPEDLSWTRDLFAQLVQVPGSRQRGSFRLRHSSGTWRWVEAVVTNLVDDPSVNAIVVNYRDITERKQAEKALLESEQRYRALFEDTPVAIWEEDFSQVKNYLTSLREQGITDFHGYFAAHPEATLACAGMIRILDVNNTALQMYQAESKEQLIYSTEQDLSQGESEHLHEVFIDIAEGKTGNRWEGADETLKGKPIEISLNWSIAPGYEKDFSRVIVTTLNITERKQIEAQINDLLAFNEKILNHSPMGILTYKLSGECVFANQHAAAIIGTSIEKLEAQNFHFLEAWKKSGLYALVETAITSPTAVSADIHHISTFGKEVWLTAYAVTFKAKEEDHLLLTISDITERKRAEEALQQSEKRYRTVVENQTEFIVRWKMDGIRTFVNDAYCRYFGLRPEEIISTSFFSLIHEEDRLAVQEKINRLRSGVTSTETEIHRIIKPDGNVGWQEWTDQALYDDRGNLIEFQSVGRDVTERKQAEMEREALFEIMQGLANTDDLQEFLKLIHRSIARVIYAENFFVVLFNENSSLFEEIYSVDQYDLPEPPSKLEKSITSYVFRTGEPLLLTDILFDEMVARGEFELVGTDSASWLGVPLKTSGRTIGVIAVQDYENPNRYTERDKEFLASIAAQVALAIERKRAEETLRKERERAQEYLDVAGVLMLALDRNGVVTLINQKGCEIVGFSYDEIIGRDWIHTFLPPAIRNEMKEVFQNLMAGNTQSFDYYENSVLTKNGEERMIAWHNTLIRDSHGAIISSLSSGEDITERKLAEAELHASEERFIQLANNIQEVFWMTDVESGEELYMSPAAQTIWGRPLEYLMNKPDAFLNSIVSEDLPLVMQALEKEKGGERVEIEYRIARPDGSVRWIWDRAFPIFNEAGSVNRIAGLSADITERKQVEEQLRKLSHAVEQSASTIVITDAEGNIEYVNRKFIETTGYTYNEAIGQNPRILKSGHTSPGEYERLWKTIKVGQEWRGELYNKKKNGELYWEYATISPILNKRGEITHFVAVKEEITQRKQAEQEIRRRAEETSALLATSLALTNLDLKATLQTIGNSAKTLFTADGCRIFLMEPDGASLRCVLALQESSSAFSDLRIKLGEGVTGTVAARGRAEIVNEMQNDPRGVQVAGTPEEAEAIMFAPLKERDRTIGVLSIRRAGSERPFQLADLELLEAFAAMAASAVSKAHLFEETQRRLAELEALYENGLAVGRLLKPSEIGNRIIETFAHYLSWHHVAIRLKRPQSDELDLIALNQPGLNEQERAAMERHFNSMISKVDQGLSGSVIQTGEPVRTGNVHSHPQYVGTQEGIQSGLYMPLRIGERIIGSISVESEAPDAFTPQDERLLATLANQAAIAFENARLYQSAQQELAERKRLQDELNREHAQLKTLFATIPDPIWLKHPQGKYLACNPVLEQLVDLPEAEILGRTDYDLFDEKLAEAFERTDQEAMNRNVSITYQEWVTYPNKQPRLMETVKTPMHDDTGDLIGVLGISHDITAMHNTQQELRESQELYRLLVETSPDGISILGLDGTIIFANQQLADLFGMKGPFDCIGTNFLSLVAPGEHPRLIELVEEAISDAVMLEEYWMVRKDGSRFYGEVRSSLSLDKAEQPRWIIGQVRDITESKTAQETIQEERQRFLDLFENTPVAIWLEDFSGVMAWMEQLRIKAVADLKDYLTRNPDQFSFALGLIRILSVNQAAVGMNGAHSKAELLEGFQRLVRDQALSSIMMHELEMLWKGKTSFEFEMTSRRLDDTLTSGILHVYVPIKNQRPDYSRVIIASTDITERVNTEKALQASEMHYRELADSITDVFFEMDSDLHYIYWNKASEHLTGITAKDAIGKSMREIFGETEEQVRIENVYEDVLRSQRSKTFETALSLENRQHIFEINAYPSTRGVSVVAKDVTDRKRSEIIMQKRFELMEYSANHALDELMQKAIDEVSQLTGSTVGFLHFMERDQITLGMQTWSTSALQQFSVPLSEGAHRPIDQAGVWADAVRERRSKIQNDYDGLPNKKDLPEGHVKIVREMVIPIIRNEKTVAVLGLGNRPMDYTRRDLEIAERFADYAWDITERKQMEVALADERNQLAKRVEERAADLIRANTNLARALRVKDEFLANMSHELRTPLNAILGLSESLGEQIAGPLNEKQQKYITTISESGRHLLALINDILDLAKIEAGQITLDINRVDIQSVCEASLRMIRQLAQKKRQDVTLEIDDDIGLIWADERRLKQMIVNLLSNAVKFTPEDGKIGLEIQGNRAENEVMITVWDNGIGMKEEDLSRLFQPFVQLDTGLARETTGTGLGLALVAQMVRLHGGSVRVSSQPEQGSRFTIVLPWEPALAADPTTKMKVTGKFRAVRPDPNNRSTILLIEDTDEVIMMIRDYLELAGYKVVTAKDGVEGITQAQLMHPDLILMDVMMPRMDGLEATRRLRSEPDFEETPIIALTALAMPSDRERCINAGMNDYMSKPVNLKELVKTIQRFLITEEANS